MASLTTEIKVNNFHQSITSRHLNVRGKFSAEMLLSWVLVEFVVTQFNFISLILLVLAEGAQSTSCEQQSEAAPFKPEGTVPSRLALGGRGAYGTRCWGSPVRQKKKHTGETQWVCYLDRREHLMQHLCSLFLSRG